VRGQYSIDESERVAGYLGGCFDELYRGLGEGAARFDDDAVVVVTFELARTFGAVRTRFEDLLAHRAGTDPRPAWGASGVICDVLTEAISFDTSGALVLFATSMVVTPRLLVSLRDAAEGASASSGAPLVMATRAGADALLASSRRIADVSSRRGPIEDESWRTHAHRLESLVDAAGFSESFGLGITG